MAIVLQTISITDLSGRLVLNTTPAGTQTIINLSTLQNGIYLVKVKTAEGENTIKLVKQE